MNRFLMILFSILMLLMTGCSDSSATKDQTPTPAATDTPAATATPEPTATLEPTATPEPTPTTSPFVAWDVSDVDTSWIDPDAKLVAFTFDDGPTAYYNELLDILEENHMHATFFVWGSKYTASYASTFERALALGCEFGNHTWSHKDLTKLSEEEIANEIEKTRALLETLTGKQNFLVRPPYGSSNMTVQLTVPAPLINWSLDSADWNNGTYDSVYTKIMNNIKDGDIVLMHASYKYTVDAVRTMIPELVSQGYQIVSVSELAAMKGKELTSCKQPYTGIR